MSFDLVVAGVRASSALRVANLSAPVLGGDLFAGGSPTITPGSWTGAPALTYSLEVNGAEVASGSQATVEAYVFALADEGFSAQVLEIPNGDVGGQVGSNTPTVDLAAKVAALYAAVSWTCYGIFLARRKALDVSVVSDTHVETWVNQGTGSDATQATDTSRPTWSDTAVNSLPGLTLDGGDYLATGNVDSSGCTAYILTAMLTDSLTSLHIPAEYGDVSGSGIRLRINDTVGGGSVGTHAARGAVARASSVATSYPCTSPTVVSGTWDSALATAETEIVVDGANVTASRPVNGNNASGVIASQPVVVGRSAPGTNYLTGALAAVIVAGGGTAIPTATETAVAALLRAAWGL